MSAIAARGPGWLTRQLARSDLVLDIGPLAFRIGSHDRRVAEGVWAMYRDLPAIDTPGFCDFHVRVDPSTGLRRWLRPQARFWLDGEEPFAPLPGHQGFPLLEWGMNWCIIAHCHHFVSLHAAVLAREGRALVMPAPSGSGKSTLTAALAFRGWRLFSDELALIDPSGVHVTPLARPISLKNQSIDLIRAWAPDARISAPVDDTTKGTVAHCAPPIAGLSQLGQTARPGWLVLPRYVPGAQPALTPIPKSQALMRLVESCFNYAVLGPIAFQALTQWVTASACYELVYDRLEDGVALIDTMARSSAAP